MQISFHFLLFWYSFFLLQYSSIILLCCAFSYSVQQNTLSFLFCIHPNRYSADFSTNFYFSYFYNVLFVYLFCLGRLPLFALYMGIKFYIFKNYQKVFSSIYLNPFKLYVPQHLVFFIFLFMDFLINIATKHYSYILVV